MRKYRIRYFCCTHTGKCRSLNQDNFICNGICRDAVNDTLKYPISGIVSASETPLFGVFDGMGGEMCGEIAAYIAAESATYLNCKNNLIGTMQAFCKETNEKICQYAQNHDIGRMGTTAAMLLFGTKEVVLCNIGDSKIFQSSNGCLRQISEDHVIFQIPGKKSPLSQNLGIPEEEMKIDPYIVSGSMNDGDVFLISSDGLTDLVTEKRIKDILENAPYEQISEKLVLEALDNGGRDNITVIVCRVEKEINYLEKVFRKRAFK